MKRQPGGRTPRIRHVQAPLAWPSARPLDTDIAEVIDLAAMLIARSNFDRAAALTRFGVSLQTAPRYSAAAPSMTPRMGAPAYVLSVWQVHPPFVKGGKPIALRSHGPSPSIKALVRLVRRAFELPQLTLDMAMEDLLRTKSIRRVGELFIPVRRKVSFRMTPAQQREHHVRIVGNVLRTVEHNARSRKPPRWFEFAADGKIPESALTAFAEEFQRLGDQALELADAAMIRRTLARTGRSPLTTVSASVVLSEDKPLKSLLVARRRTSRY